MRLASSLLRYTMSSTSISASARDASSFRVISYNVLSSHLADPDRFPRCQPADLDARMRLSRLKEALRRECEKGTVVCLQEISTTWAGELHPLFAERGYHFVTGLYGHFKNGYMGVGLAWPVASFEALDIAITRVADTKAWGKQPPPSPESASASVLAVGSSLLLAPLRRAAGAAATLLRWSGLQGLLPAPAKSERPLDEPYESSRRRMNQLVFARLRLRQHGESAGCSGRGGRVVCVGTYHMPCVFFNPPVMTIHTALVAQLMKRLSGNDPQILAGDFNFVPGSACYRIVTEGRLEQSAAEYPTPPPWETEASGGWEPALEAPLRSAYRECDGREPDFTNNAQVEDQEPFVETLDYIFHTPDLVPTATVPLRRREEVTGPYPTAEEPSDHVLIGAEFRWADST